MLEQYDMCLYMCILVLFVLSAISRVSSIPRQTIVRASPAGVRAILDPPSHSNLTLLRSRASPNARLISAFKLTNTFVRPDLTTHSKFVRHSKSLLRAARHGSVRFAQVVAEAVELSLPDASVDFHAFVHAVTLRTIIVGLLDPTATVASLDSDDLRLAAELITEIWLLSKQTAPIPGHLLEMLQARLQRLIPDRTAYPNPLDFVIPTWETLWRVVAVTLAHIESDAQACRAFLDFLDSPEPEQFRAHILGGVAPSVQDYVSESLRLHPPVRHITRHVFQNTRLTGFLPRFLAAYLSPRVDTVVADIESAQRSAYWASVPGDAPPDEFDAARFTRAPDRTREVLAFGWGPLRCVAGDWAPIAAAVVVATILNRLDGVGYQLVRGSRVGGRRGWDGWEVRKAQ